MNSKCCNSRQMPFSCCRYAAETGSVKAGMILANWAAERANFLQVCPKEMLVHLAHPLSDEARAVPAE